ASRTYPMTRESMMADISSSVAEKALCWWEGRKRRRMRVVRLVWEVGIPVGILHAERPHTVCIPGALRFHVCSKEQGTRQSRNLRGLVLTFSESPPRIRCCRTQNM